MKQVNNRNKIIKNKVAAKKTRKKPLFGTSKLEEKFAKDFLEKLEVRYIYQYFINEIGRYYDFAVFLGNENELRPGDMVLIEIDGGYW